jgi:antitoxin HicB
MVQFFQKECLTTYERGDGMTSIHIGSSLDDFLEEEGILEEVIEVASKRVLVWQIEQIMNEKHITKTELARRMQTSRSAVDRLLDVEDNSSTLKTLMKAAQSIGKQLKLELV